MRSFLYRSSLFLLTIWSLFIFGEAAIIWFVVATDQDGTRSQRLLDMPDSWRTLLFHSGNGMTSTGLSAFVMGMLVARFIDWFPVAIPLSIISALTKPRAETSGERQSD